MTHMHTWVCLKKMDRGFTLVEILVALAISSIVLLVATAFFISTNKSNTIQGKVAGMQQDLRAAMEMMTRDIRMAGMNPSGDATDVGFVHNETYDNGPDDNETDDNETDDNGPDDTTNNHSIAIRYDHNGDGTSEFDLCYAWDSATETLMFRNGAGSDFEALTEEGIIHSVAFKYTLSDGSTTTDPASGDLGRIRIVSIEICGQITGAYSDEFTSTYCFSSNVRPRNM